MPSFVTCRTCLATIRNRANEYTNWSGRCARCKNAVDTPTPSVAPAQPAELLAADREKRRLQSELTSLRGRYNEAQASIDLLQQQLQIVAALRENAAEFIIEPHLPTGTSESTVVLVASDWHIEEKVGAEIGGLNVFDLDIAKRRAERFFRAGLRLTKLLQQDTHIDTMVLALLGDFITNELHGAENAETNALQPSYALVEAQNLIISGIRFLLDNSELTLVIPCHSGNHARTTLKTRFSSENGHSLEYLMYLHLQAWFRNEPRVTFLIANGMHSYLPIYDKVIRFHHGHAVKYGGGVGGITIPVLKAVAQWNRGRHADLDVFGHFHTLVDGDSFLCNGSLVGYNGFALSIKASFQPPRQLLFMLNKKYGRCGYWPISLEPSQEQRR